MTPLGWIATALCVMALAACVIPPAVIWLRLWRDDQRSVAAFRRRARRGGHWRGR